jgi:hypothetical protein
VGADNGSLSDVVAAGPVGAVVSTKSVEEGGVEETGVGAMRAKDASAMQVESAQTL